MDFFKNPFVLLGVYMTAIFFLTLITRRIVETAKPDLKKQADANAPKITYKTQAARWWNEVILYSIGPVYGTVMAHAMKDTAFFPAMFKGHWLVTTMAGLCAGFVCGWGFKVLKKTFSRATGVSEKELDEPADIPDVPGGE